MSTTGVSPAGALGSLGNLGVLGEVASRDGLAWTGSAHLSLQLVAGLVLGCSGLLLVVLARPQDDLPCRVDVPADSGLAPTAWVDRSRNEIP